MFWAHEVPVVAPNDKVSVTLWSGTNYFGVTSNNAPPPDSWAANVDNDVAIWHITIQAGGKLTLPMANQGSAVNRSLFYIEGGASQMKVDGMEIGNRVVLQVKPDEEITLEMSDEADTAGELLLLQGRPLNEPVKQYGPFVMNTDAEINQAFADYRATQFGGWPWSRDDMIFPKEKGRFAKLNGKETGPPDAACIE